MENMNKCPGCSQHCDKNNLQCGKGEAYFNADTTPSREDSGGKHHCCHGKKQHEHRCEGHGHKHRRPEFPAGSLADLMARCGHKLFHGGEKSMFAALSEEEQHTLQNLLTKLLST